MYNITLTTDAAVILRDALRVYKERWSGGDPEEQEAISFLELQFTKIVLESYIDAWRLTMERGLSFTCANNDWTTKALHHQTQQWSYP